MVLHTDFDSWQAPEQYILICRATEMNGSSETLALLLGTDRTKYKKDAYLLSFRIGHSLAHVIR